VSTPTPSAGKANSALPRIELPVEQGATVEGLVNVVGHDLYARCSSKGSPTVVYFRGWIPDTSEVGGVALIRFVEGAGGGKHRICSYDRRNTGHSETVEGTQSPQDFVGDVDGVLNALGENGPSFCSEHPSAAWSPARTPSLTPTRPRESFSLTPRSLMTTS
jgi:hypothetical protein